MITDKHLVCFQNAIDHSHSNYVNKIIGVQEPCADRWLVTFTCHLEGPHAGDRDKYVRCALFIDDPRRGVTATSDIIVK